MKRSIVFLVAIAGVASADPRHVLVLKSEGTADPATRLRVDAAVLKLAKNLDGKVSAGDITFGDAAAAVGCQPDTPTCKDDVLATLAVDELVAITVNTGPGGLKVVVRRASKTGSQDATTTVAANTPDRVEGIGPLFGLAAPAPPVDTAPVPVPPAPAPVDTAPAPVDTASAPAPTPVVAPPPAPVPTEEDHSSRHRWEIIGMAGGGGMVALGLLMWGAASSTQNDINSAPNKTPADIQHLKDLEKKGDDQANFGNFLVVGGLVAAGVGGYFYWRDSRASSTRQARIAPAVFPNGAGVTLTIGGSP
jgi:hypothetical protein